MVLLAGCASQPGAPVSDAGESRGGVLDTRPAGAPEQTETPAEDNSGWRLSQPEPAKPAPPPGGNSDSAVNALLGQAERYYGDGDYQHAIASAERALRIDRRSARAYLLLAQSYWRLAVPAQSEQFARQGLRYSGSDASLTRALETVLAQVAR